MLKKIIFIILLTNMANSNIDKALPNESNSQINWDFIEELEGNLNYGHQPSQNSGVTIGSGFDLKGKTESDLKDMGFDPDLIDIFKPYLGLTGDEAAAAIKNNNLVLNPEQTSKVNRLSKKYYTDYIIDQYESTGKKFNKLSPEQQTVIMSVGYQYGNLKTRTPKFWKGVINDDWDSVDIGCANYRNPHNEGVMKAGYFCSPDHEYAQKLY